MGSCDDFSVEASGMSYLDTIYDSSISPFAIIKESKYCELCGYSFCRVVGTQDKYCFSCHRNWNERVDTSTLPRVSTVEDFQPEVIAAPKRTCRIKKEKTAKAASKTVSITKKIKDLVWNRESVGVRV
jgi:hypothetical protein